MTPLTIPVAAMDSFELEKAPNAVPVVEAEERNTAADDYAAGLPSPMGSSIGI